MIKYSVLASGSTGNCIYVGSEHYNFLIDAGLSGKRIEAALQTVGVDIKNIDGIFISHEHDDHVRGVGVLARKYNIPLYANKRTLGNLPASVGSIEDSLKIVFETGTVKSFANLNIETFEISHDAVEPVGFVITDSDSKLSVVTDLGYVSAKIKEKIKGSDVLIFESNHDVNLLRMSSYPWSVKQRILSDVGHLSNETSAEALAEVITKNTQRIYLAHLSKENNLIDLARLTVKNILEEYGITEEDVKLMDTYPNKPTQLETILKKELVLE